MERLSRIDIKNFADYYCDLKYLEAKINKNKTIENEEQISQKNEDLSKNCFPLIKVGNLLKLSVNVEMVFILAYIIYIYTYIRLEFCSHFCLIFILFCSKMQKKKKKNILVMMD